MTAEALRGLVVEKVADKLNETAARQEQKIAAKAARHIESLDRLAAHLSALEVWTRSDAAARRPRFSREEIAAAAVHLADEEGFAALSMRRLAAELDAGTMTLYHYIRTKDELLTLVTDAVMGEVVLPDGEPVPADWREALTVIATRTRDALRRHPWTLDITDDPPIGPNSVRHFDQSLQALASLDVSLADKLDIVTAVDEYVFGYCVHERNNLKSPEPAVRDDLVGYVDGLVATGAYPQLAALAEQSGLEAVWDQVEAHVRDGGRFERNLRRLLGGIEADLGLPGTRTPS